MQWWEYQTWLVVYGRSVEAVDDEAINPQRQLSVALRLAGDEGWELAAVESGARGSISTLKRPKE